MPRGDRPTTIQAAWKDIDELSARLEEVNQFGAECLNRIEDLLGVKHSASHGWDYVLEQLESRLAAPVTASEVEGHRRPREFAVRFIDHIQGTNSAERECEVCGGKWSSPGNLFCPHCKNNRIAPPAATTVPNSSEVAAIDLIARERQRQISAEGWTPDHDAEHDHGELAIAAACYAVEGTDAEVRYPYFDAGDDDRGWPWDADWDKRKKHDRARQLVIAGALIVAELERIARDSGKVEQDA